MSSTIEDRLQESAERLVAVTGFPLAFSGTVTSTGTLRLGTFAGVTVGALRGVSLDFGYGLGGQVLALRRPIAVDDYVTSATIRHRYDHIIAAEGLHAMIAVPIVIDRHAVAVMYTTAHRPLSVGSRVLDLVLTEARQLEQEIAIERAVRTRVADAGGLDRETTADLYAELRALASKATEPSVRDELLAVCARLFSPPSDGAGLTPRERDILTMVARGSANATIARDLGLTVYTVKSYLKTIMHKLGASNRFEAVVKARERNALL